MKKAIVLFDTLFGNTEKIARALAQGIDENGVETDCIKVDEVDINTLAEYDFLAIGGPTHMAGMSKPMKDFLEEMKTIDVSGKKGLCLDTRNHSRLNRFDLNSAAKRIEKNMKKMNVKMIQPRKSAIVEGREGPLEKEAYTMFEERGKEIAAIIR